MEELYRQLIQLQSEYDQEKVKHATALMAIRIRANTAIKEAKFEFGSLIERTDLSGAISEIEKELSNRYLNTIK